MPNLGVSIGVTLKTFSNNPVSEETANTVFLLEELKQTKAFMKTL